MVLKDECGENVETLGIGEGRAHDGMQNINGQRLRLGAGVTCKVRVGVARVQQPSLFLCIGQSQRVSRNSSPIGFDQFRSGFCLS